MLLKDLLPLSDNHFVMGSPPRPLKNAVYEEGWTLPEFPITITMPHCSDNALMREHVLDYADRIPLNN